MGGIQCWLSLFEQKLFVIVVVCVCFQEQRVEIFGNVFVSGFNVVQLGSVCVVQVGSEIVCNIVEVCLVQVEQMVELICGKFEVQSGVWVIEVVDEIFGILIDIYV